MPPLWQQALLMFGAAGLSFALAWFGFWLLRKR